METKVGSIATWLDSKKAEHIIALDVRGVCPLWDAMIVATAVSARHAQALAEEVGGYFRQHGWPVLGIEGASLGQWVVVDGGDVVVHIFLEEVRQRYDLEGLYSRGRSMPVAGASR